MRRSRSKESVRREEDLEELIGADNPLSIEELMPGLEHYAELKVCGNAKQVQQFIGSAQYVVGEVGRPAVWVYELGRSPDGEFQAVAIVTRMPRASQDLLDAMRTEVETQRAHTAEYPELLLMLTLNRFGPDPLDAQRLVEWLHFRVAGRIDAVERNLSDQEWLETIENQTNAFMGLAANLCGIEFAVFYTPWSGESPAAQARPVTRLRGSNGNINHLGILRFDLLVVTTKEQLESLEDLVDQRRTGFGKVYRRSIRLGESAQQQIVLAMFSARATKRNPAHPANLLRSNAEVLAQMHGAAVMMRSIHWGWHMWHGLELANQGEMEIWNNNELVYLDRQARKHCLNEDHVSDDAFNHPLLIFVDEALDNVTELDRSQRDEPAMGSEDMTTRIEKFLEQ